jgi:signal transduction histidine kinase/CheY-like chemotaxis protein
VLLALAAFMPLGAYAAFNGYISLKARQAGIDDQIVASAHALSETVDRQILSGLDEVQTLAAAPALDPKGGSLATFAILARRTRSRHPEWSAVILLDPDGRWLFNTDSTAHRLANDLPSLREAVRTRAAAVGDIVSDSDGQWGVPLRAPVIRDGKLIYVVTVVIRPAFVHGLIDSLRGPASWIVGVVNGYGHIVARSADDGHSVGRGLNAEAAAARARGGGGTYRGRTLSGLDTQSAYWMSPVTHWSVHIGILRDIYEAPLRQMAVTLLAGFLVCLLLAAALVVLWVRDFDMRRSHAAAVEQATRIDALGRLTGGVAHDFNNLLTVIQGNAEILSRRLKDMPQAEKSLMAIRTATDRAAKLTRQLLVFARGGPAGPVVVDLAAKIEDLLGPISQLVGAGVVVDTALEPGLPPVSVDPLQLEAALLNLAANARDAMDGAGRMEISLRQSGPWVALEVRDAGAGFDPAVLARVFDPFFTTKPVGKGTGLGLSQVYGLMKGVQGEVKASNPPGGGGMVTLLFPPSTQPLAPVEGPATASVPSRDAPAGGPDGVLLVDDNDAVRVTTAAYLRECGLTVLEAADAARALEVLRTVRVEAVVSDIVMPGEMDGMALAQVIRTRWPGLPVILVSGYSESAAEARDRGFPVMNKPYSLPDLETRLRTLFDKPVAADI